MHNIVSISLLMFWDIIFRSFGERLRCGCVEVVEAMTEGFFFVTQSVHVLLFVTGYTVSTNYAYELNI